MMASNIDFPIFIGSTHYDLVDLRAELSAFLANLGYRPILSSEEGFPDSPAQREPWEHCLDVLKSCLVVVIILDGRYGTPESWPHFKDIFGDRKVSPTHGEFLYAKAVKKPMLIFIREHLIRDYQWYRQATKNVGDDREALDHLRFPRNVDKQVLEFIQEIETTSPTPWYHEFRDITQVKTGVQRQLLNELAKAFRFRDNCISTLIQKLNQLLDGVSDDERADHLRSIGCAKELIDRVEQSNKEKELLKAQLQEKNDALEAAEGSSKGEIARLTQEKEALEVKIAALERDCINFIPTAAGVVPSCGDPSSIYVPATFLDSSLMFDTEVNANNLVDPSAPQICIDPSESQFCIDPSASQFCIDSSASEIFADPNTVVLSHNTCAGCSASLDSLLVFPIYCSKCNRAYCRTCLPENVLGPSEQICSQCRGT